MSKKNPIAKAVTRIRPQVIQPKKGSKAYNRRKIKEEDKKQPE